MDKATTSASELIIIKEAVLKSEMKMTSIIKKVALNYDIVNVCLIFKK